jgi:Trk-type K+ transport system membrane component
MPFSNPSAGFTTTGSSILTDIESVSQGLLFWRSFIQWLGGMGIIVLSIAILPFLGVGGMQLYKAEVPSPVPDKLKPRIRDTAMILWKVYALFHAGPGLFLMLGGMNLYDALCHAFTTMPTGGFSTQKRLDSPLRQPYIDLVSFFSCCWPASIFPCTTNCFGESPGLLERFRVPLFLRRGRADRWSVLNIFGTVYDKIGRPCATRLSRWCRS